MTRGEGDILVGGDDGIMVLSLLSSSDHSVSRDVCGLCACNSLENSRV